MPLYSNSLEDIFKQIKETNLKFPFSICSAKIDETHEYYIAEELLYQEQIKYSILAVCEDAIFTMEEKPWEKLRIDFEVYLGKDKDKLNVSAVLFKKEFEQLNESVDAEEVILSVAEAITKQIFSCLLKKLGIQ